MFVPPELLEISSVSDNFPAEFNWRIAIERHIYTMTVIEVSKFFKLSLQVTGIPKEYVV